MGARFVKVGVVYFIMAILLGIIMHHLSAPEFGSVAKYFPREHSLIPLHAHVGLMGAVYPILVGLIYQTFPRAGKSTLATLHFWTSNIALAAIFSKIVITMVETQQFGGFFEPAKEGINSFGGVMYLISLILFIVNIFKNVRNEGGTFLHSKEQS